MKIYLTILTILGFSFQNLSQNIYDYENILNLRNTPKKHIQKGLHAFFDKGSWFGFSIDDNKEKGGFSGPYLLGLEHGVWLSRNLISLDLVDNQFNSILSGPIKTSQKYLPGKLTNEKTFKHFNLTYSLIFNSSTSAILEVSVKNISDHDQSFTPFWSGDIFKEAGKCINGKNEIKIQLAKGQILSLKLIDQSVTETLINDNKFSITNSKDILRKGSSKNYYFQMNYHPDKIHKVVKLTSQDCEKTFKENSKRWKNYLKFISNKNYSENEKTVLVKSVLTLINNWRSPAGELKHDGLFPSYHYKWFQGFWAWDSWKHAVALAKIDSELAQNQIRAMYDFQDKYGMIADCVFRDTLIEKHNWRDTKPPLSGWAIWEVYKISKDKSFLKELYPKLKKYHNFWYERRDFDKDGLCEYGSTDGTLVAAKWESGMDNAIRFDNTEIIKNSLFSLNTESVDLNSYLAKEKEYLSKIAKELHLKNQSQKWLDDSKQLADRINQNFYDKELGFYFDIEAKKHKKLTQAYGPEGWTPLWCGLSNNEQAKKIKDIITDTNRFNTFVPFPTIDYSHQAFNPLKGYWRGPVWLDQAWFGISGLKKYGYLKEAENLKNKIINNAEGISTKGMPLRENYHPLTGKGLNASHFSWSAAHLILMIAE